MEFLGRGCMRNIIQILATKFYIWAFKISPKRNKTNKKEKTENNGKTT